jgi:hypothetical protein
VRFGVSFWVTLVGGVVVGVGASGVERVSESDDDIFRRLTFGVHGDGEEATVDGFGEAEVDR